MYATRNAWCLWDSYYDAKLLRGVVFVTPATRLTGSTATVELRPNGDFHDVFGHRIEREIEKKFFCNQKTLYIVVDKADAGKLSFETLSTSIARILPIMAPDVRVYVFMTPRWSSL